MPTLISGMFPRLSQPPAFPTINSLSSQVTPMTSDTTRFEGPLARRNAASIAKFLSTAIEVPPFTTGSTASSTANVSQDRGQNTKSLKSILIGVGVAATAIVGLLVAILLVYCRRRKRRLSGRDNRIVNPFTKQSSPTHASQPPDTLEIAKKYIDVLENQIERMRREAATATATTQSQAGPSTLDTPSLGEPAKAAPPPQYESI
ncbi:hypothetical protein JR316_0012231 [Psilocybe cubensis]|uniref:Mid2 domain-containing protein n=2 Tax=Psilocybe cubensis TaxID=181762 RepID=A0A8H7XRM6_PSICU|nr:hypothetical protein JR316_0012231 [Psilocybe cubensis]KAH9475120.1 hypothetical protein JR316_0012231 [Psilocybe cubensis]